MAMTLHPADTTPAAPERVLRVAPRLSRTTETLDSQDRAPLRAALSRPGGKAVPAGSIAALETLLGF
ncbi:hypothetical protein MWN34_07260 [Ancylobacter sp. 6x-1]|uniref:Uncharacterized protein n=1 Tax=Ancylobacter crimeensis TaxID=2579147 RepID=A0ABT0D9S8_9HYPH|nr:hypothetical protein [Ancylobacter crimeensis]MCK0196710.1 hypothetical protein [Ancylobacter crimeensis]